MTRSLVVWAWCGTDWRALCSLGLCSLRPHFLQRETKTEQGSLENVYVLQELDTPDVQRIHSLENFSMETFEQEVCGGGLWVFLLFGRRFAPHCTAGSSSVRPPALQIGSMAKDPVDGDASVRGLDHALWQAFVMLPQVHTARTGAALPPTLRIMLCTNDLQVDASLEVSACLE